MYVRIVVICLLMVSGMQAYLSAAVLSLQSGDVLQVNVVNKNGIDLVTGLHTQTPSPQQNQDPHLITVTEGGSIYVPNVGVFQVRNKEPKDVEQLIAQRSGGQEYKVISVLMVSPRYDNIYVLGEVQKPGLYKVDPSSRSANKLISLIGMAGGFTDQADRESIAIRDENAVTVTINLFDMTQRYSITSNITLANNSSIIVGQISGKIYVLGEVKNPGGIPYVAMASFSDYIALAGGTNASAAADNIGIVRREDGKVSVYKLSLNNYMTALRSKGLAIKNGDIIYVPRSGLADWKDIVTLFGIASDSLMIYDLITR